MYFIYYFKMEYRVFIDFIVLDYKFFFDLFYELSTFSFFQLDVFYSDFCDFLVYMNCYFLLLCFWES